MNEEAEKRNKWIKTKKGDKWIIRIKSYKVINK